MGLGRHASYIELPRVGWWLLYIAAVLSLLVIGTAVILA
jgi:hypothetical protein